MKYNYSLSSDQDLAKEVIDLYVNRRLSAPKIVEQKGCSSLTILNILRSNGVEIRRRGTYARKILPEMVERIIKEYEGGRSLTMIASRYGVNPNTIYRHLLMNGVMTRPDAKVMAKDVRKIHEENKKMPSRETVERLAREFEVTVNVIRYHVKKLG